MAIYNISQLKKSFKSLHHNMDNFRANVQTVQDFTKEFDSVRQERAKLSKNIAIIECRINDHDEYDEEQDIEKWKMELERCRHN